LNDNKKNQKPKTKNQNVFPFHSIGHRYCQTRSKKKRKEKKRKEKKRKEK